MAGNSVLLVCTANRCRSPLAAALFTARAVAVGLPWTFSGAGTNALPGETTEAETIEVLHEVDIPARAVPVYDIESALRTAPDLVLTAERRHRGVVLEIAPALVGRTFTLFEIERLLGSRRGRVADATPGAVARLAESGRAAAGVGGAGDDLVDPIGRPLDAFRQCRTAIERVVDSVVAATGR